MSKKEEKNHIHQSISILLPLPAKKITIIYNNLLFMDVQKTICYILYIHILAQKQLPKQLRNICKINMFLNIYTQIYMKMPALEDIVQGFLVENFSRVQYQGYQMCVCVRFHHNYIYQPATLLPLIMKLSTKLYRDFKKKIY